MAEVNPNTTPQPNTAPQPQQTSPTQPTQPPQTSQFKPAPAKDCGCPAINPAEWDKQKKKLDKTFYKSFSPRLLYYPFSFVIDLDRAKKAAAKKGYQVVQNGMILDTGGMFLGSVLVEVTGAKADDKNIVPLSGKELYTKVSRRPFKEIKTDIAELEAELGAHPGELYIWWTSCPKCTDKKEVKAILIAVQGAPEGVGAKATQLFKKAVDKAGQAAGQVAATAGQVAATAEQVATKAEQEKPAVPAPAQSPAALAEVPTSAQSQPPVPPAAPVQPETPAPTQPPAQPVATTPPVPEPPKQA